MGKKSSSKKQKRTQGAASHVDSAGEKLAKSDASPTRRQKLQAWIREKWLVTGLTIASLLMLGGMAIFMWTRPVSLDIYLPRETIAFAEVNTNFTDAQWEMLNAKAPDVVGDAIKFLNETLQIDFTKEVHPWLARRAGLALLPTPGGKESQQLDQYKPIVLLEIRDEQQALAFFEKRRLQGISEKLQQQTHRGTTIYSYPASSPYTFTRLGRYLIVTPDEPTAKAVIDATHDKDGTLASQKSFQEIQKNLPRENLAFGFIKPVYIASHTESDPLGLAAMFTNGLSGEGLSITADSRHLIAQHFALFDSSAVQPAPALKNQPAPAQPKPVPTPYRANLAQLFSPNITFFAGGTNASETIQHITTLLTKKNFTGSAIEAALKQAIDGTLGELTSQEFNELFSREYAIGLDGDAIVIAIELDGVATNYAAQLFKKMKNILQKNPRFSQETFYETISGNIGILATTEQARNEAVSRMNTGDTWKNSTKYKESIEPQLNIYTKKASDIIFIESALLKKYLPHELNFLTKAAHLSLASSTTENGIKTTLLLTP